MARDQTAALVVRIQIPGIYETLRKFQALPKDAERELRKASLEVAKVLAAAAKAAAEGDSGQSALIAPTVRALFDRVPAVQAGGSKLVGSNNVPAYKVLFGSEFGAVTLPQYRPFYGKGYWFFRTVRENQDEIAEKWDGVANEIIRKWAE